MCCPWFPPYSNRMFTIVACHVVNGVVYYTVRYKMVNIRYSQSTLLIYAPDEVMRYHFIFIYSYFSYTNPDTSSFIINVLRTRLSKSIKHSLVNSVLDI